MVPPKEWLETKPWHFNDADGSVVNHSRLYYLNRKNLPGLAFDTDVPGCTPLSAKSPLDSSPPSANVGMSPLNLQPAIKSFSNKAIAGQVSVQRRVDPDSPASTDISIQALPSSMGSTLKNSVMSASVAAPRRVRIEIGGIRVEGITSSGFDVYVNLPAGQAPTRSSPSYVGTLALFGLAGHSHHGQTGRQSFDITQLVAKEPASLSKLTVSVVPFDFLAPRGGQPRLRRSVGVTFDSVRVLILEGSSKPII